MVREGRVQEVTANDERIRGLLKQAPEKGTRTFTAVRFVKPAGPSCSAS